MAWLGLHRDDNDPHWFLAHLLEAVRRALPSAEDAIGDLAALIEQNAEDMQGYTLSALLEVDRRRTRAGSCSTFDDWHLVDDCRGPAGAGAPAGLRATEPVDRAHQPSPAAAAVEPAARAGSPVEIDADLLRFDLDETREFLVELNGLRLDGDDVARLSDGTDGWVAALQLASLSLRDCADPGRADPRLLRASPLGGRVPGGERARRAPGRVLDFLLATSVCDRLCGDLAGVLADRGDGQAMLEELERRDLFLRPLDAEREWFRYHHLFADYLRRRLDRDHPDRVVELHSRASAWFAEQDLVPEAVAHALAGGDVRRATDLVEQHAMPLVEHSRMVSLLGLLGRLPGTAADDRPGLLMAVAWANCLLQRTAAAQASLDALRPGAAGAVTDHEEMRSEADVVQACIDVYGDRTDRAEAWSSTEPAGARSYRPWVVAVAANIQTFCDIHAMRFADARERQRWAVPFHERTIGPFAGVYGRCFAGIAALSQLDIPAAEEHLGARSSWPASRPAAARTPRSWPARCSASCTTCGASSTRPSGCSTRAASSGAESGVVDFMIASFALLARIKAGRGATDESAELLVEGAQVADRLGLARLRAAVGAERIVQLLARGRIKEAHRVARDLPEGSSRHGGIGVRIDQLRTSSLAAVLSAEGDHDRAVALVEDLIAEATDNGQVRVAVELSIQLSGIEQRAARYLAAERTLAGVLDRVVAAGVPQLVHEGGPDVRVVLARIVGRLREGDATSRSRPPRSSLPWWRPRRSRSAGPRRGSQRPGARGRPHARRRAQQPADRARPGRHRQHGEVAPEEHLQQARRRQPRRGGVRGATRWAVGVTGVGPPDRPADRPRSPGHREAYRACSNSP